MEHYQVRHRRQLTTREHPHWQPPYTEGPYPFFPTYSNLSCTPKLSSNLTFNRSISVHVCARMCVVQFGVQPE